MIIDQKVKNSIAICMQARSKLYLSGTATAEDTSIVHA